MVVILNMLLVSQFDRDWPIGLLADGKPACLVEVILNGGTLELIERNYHAHGRTMVQGKQLSLIN